MTAAVFGLTGVLLGGVVTGAVQWWHTRATKLIARRVAMRLVRHELGSASAHVSVTHQTTPEGERHLELKVLAGRGAFRTEAWDEYRHVLAEHMPDDVWREVSGAYSQIDWLLGWTSESTFGVDADTGHALDTLRSAVAALNSFDAA